MSSNELGKWNKEYQELSDKMNVLFKEYQRISGLLKEKKGNIMLMSELTRIKKEYKRCQLIKLDLIKSMIEEDL